MLTVK